MNSLSFKACCRNYLWYLFLFIPFQHICAQPEIQKLEYPFELISEVNGLSQSMVNCITQDHYGFMWFGTKDELNRYDGRQFVVYKSSPADNGRTYKLVKNKFNYGYRKKMDAMNKGMIKKYFAKL